MGSLFPDANDLLYDTHHGSLRSTALYQYQPVSPVRVGNIGVGVEQEEGPHEVFDEYRRLNQLKALLAKEEQKIQARHAQNRALEPQGISRAANINYEAPVDEEDEEMWRRLSGPSNLPYEPPPAQPPPIPQYSPIPAQPLPPAIRRTKSTTDVQSNRNSQWLPPQPPQSEYVPHNFMPYTVSKETEFVRNPPNSYSDWSMFSNNYPEIPYLSPTQLPPHQPTPSSSNTSTPIYNSVASPASFISTSISSFPLFPIASTSAALPKPIPSSSDLLAQELLKQKPSRPNSRKSSTSRKSSLKPDLEIPVYSTTPQIPLHPESDPEETKDDKRKRNTEASARFRAKKKKLDASLAENATELRAKVVDLEAIKMNLIKENEWLKSVLAK